MKIVSMNYLLEAGVHFGHQKRRWNPKMGKYIYTSRDDIHIIDLQKTVEKLEEAYEALKLIAERGGKVLYVGTKKQSQEAVEESASRVEMFFVNERWLGGTLTNFRTIKSRVKRMEEIETMETDGTFEALTKKEVAKLEKEYGKLNRNLRGIRAMEQLPSALIIIDPKKEEIAIKEARKLNIPVFGLVDTNADPDMVDFVIPANDDAIRSVKLLLGVLTNAVASVNGKEVIDYLTEEDRQQLSKDEPKEVVQEEKVANEKEEIQEELKEEQEEPESVDLTKLTVSELKEMAKERNIEGYSKLKKAELIDVLK